MKSIKLKLSAALLVLTIGLTMSGCFSNDTNTDFTKVGHIIELPDAIAGNQDIFLSGVPFKANGDDDTLLVHMNVTGEFPLAKDLTVTVAADDQIVTDYNTLVTQFNTDNATAITNGTLGSKSNYVILPPASYSLASTSIKVKAGQRSGNILVIVHGSNTFNLAIKYAIGLKMTAVDNPAVTISGNIGSIVQGVAIKNDYDGYYTFGPGMIERYTGGVLNVGDALMGPFTKLNDRLLATLDATDNGWVPLWANGGGVGGIGGTNAVYIFVDKTMVSGLNNPFPAGTFGVSVACTANATMHNISGSKNYYDPATKTFYLAFTWGSANVRNFWTTLTYSGPS